MKDTLWYLEDALSRLPDNTVITVELLKEIIKKTKYLRALDELNLQDSFSSILYQQINTNF